MRTSFLLPTPTPTPTLTPPIVEALVPAAPDLQVVVQRDWNGWQKAMTPLSALEDIPWRQPAGAPRPLIHAYVACGALVSGDVPHDCAGAGPDHRLLVCVLKCHTPALAFERLVERAAAQRQSD